MTPEEKFQFDLEGYLIVKGVLSRAEASRLARAADEVWPRKPSDGPFRRTAHVSRWGSDFLALMDHPRVLPYLAELVGTRLRVDHDYCIFTQKGAPPNYLHGGPRIGEADHWYYYSDGVMRNGLTVATWCLTDAAAGDGGFCCVPGSHKTNFLRDLPRDVALFERDVHWVVQPPVEAGDVLLFTEALVHGTQPWRAELERRVLLYKYSPGHSSWAKVGYDVAAYPDASERQLRLMAPPSIEDHPQVVPRSSRG